MLEQIFLKVLDMSRTASLIIVSVFLIRILLKRFPKYLSYMLWSIVLFRLLCPITLESKISPVPSLEPVFNEYVSQKDMILTKVSSEEAAVPYIGENGSETGQRNPSQIYPVSDLGKEKASPLERFILYGKYVWILGMGIMGLYCVISTIKLRKRVATSIPYKKNIYMMDEMVSPFVMGILTPKIYLPECLSKKERKYIILHEKFHIRRLDYIVKPVAFAALSIHWFNPFVWAAFIFFCKDMEMSCDEAVIKKLGENIRADYSASLLALSTQHRILRGLPVDFGEGDTKGRVKNLAAFRKTPKSIVAVLFVGVIVLIVCLMFTRKAGTTDINISKEEIDGIETTETSYVQEEMSVTEEQTKNTYSNVSISLEYPKNWSVKENRGEDGAKIIFYDEAGRGSFSFEQCEAWQIELDLKDTEEEYQRDLETVYGDEAIEILELSKTTIGDCDAVKLVYSYTEENQKYIVEKYYVVAELAGFEFKCEYEEGMGEAYKNVLKEILDSVEFKAEKEEAKSPTKEEVLAMREVVLAGMSESEIERLKENIKVANQTMESAYLNDNLYVRLKDAEDLYWNYFDEKGEIQIGWTNDGNPKTTYNRFHAENFIILMEEMKDSVQNEALKADLQTMIEETRLAADTHEVEHAERIYQYLHDMDYYLLRYGPEDVGKYVSDKSLICEYYGVLEVYQ